jgi:hypothetical protein
MSDSQLLTGLSMLVSGYTQLKCGLSIYHWEHLLNLAWFSAITHFCCLTFLRQYFRKNRSAQVWRIPCMIALVSLLAVGLIPSARYDGPWYTKDNKYLSFRDYAICFFEPFPNVPTYVRHYNDSYDWKGKMQPPILAAVILVFGMLVRLWRLHKTSMAIYTRAHQWTSFYMRKMLRASYAASTRKSITGRLILVLVHRPFLAIFLFVRMVLVTLSSKMSEVRIEQWLREYLLISADVVASCRLDLGLSAHVPTYKRQRVQVHTSRITTRAAR